MVRLFIITTIFFWTMPSTIGLAIDSKSVKKEILSGKAIIVDVREFSEIQSGMISGAIWLPTSEITSRSPRYFEIIKRLKQYKVVYVYCTVGALSGLFKYLLEKINFTAEDLGSYKGLVKNGFSSKLVKQIKPKPCPWLCGP